jgi:HPt (histidine-containing phosphotransfer) domain-containing protein
MFLKNGFTDFISKPIDIMRLDTVLNKYIREKQTPETLLLAEKLKEEADRSSDTGGLLANVNIEGLDIAAGLANYGSEKTYLQILRSYLSFTPDLLGKLSTPSAENLHSYMIAVHGLKSSSRGVAANEIGAKAEALEYAAKAGDLKKVREGNPAFINSVETLLADLSEVLGGLSEGETAREKKAQPENRLIRELYEAASAYNTGRMEEIMEEIERYSYTDDRGIVNWLRAQIENLEYEAIITRLEEETYIAIEEKR